MKSASPEPAPFRLVLRSPEEKADPDRSWSRSDEDFFAAGACHILAGVFLNLYSEAGFNAVMIRPAAGFRGTHVLASDGRRIFDARGWNEHDYFLRRYTELCQETQPGWSCTLNTIHDPLSWDFCQLHQHRHATQFLHDPIPRAEAYLKKFSPP